MIPELADSFRPVAPPRIVEQAYSDDQHRRLLEVVRREGPWPLILAENFTTPEEVIATTSGELPEGVEASWDMVLTPVFRGYLARQGVCCQACGPVAERRPQGLDIRSVLGVDPDREDGWRITTGDTVNQRIPAEELRFLVHWGARLFMDHEELSKTFDHSDDIDAETAIGMLIDDMRRRGVSVETPSDPMNDRGFVRKVSQVYDIGGSASIPPEAVDEAA